MSFKQFPTQLQVVQLLQRSLEKGRLAHAYLFSGSDLNELETAALTLARTLNCENPLRGESGNPIDSCDVCLNCRKIEGMNHPDVQHVRPESKSRIITIDQVRDLMHTIHLKPTQAQYKVAIISGGDRLNPQAANAFLKTLEEPPAQSILILLSTEPSRLLETILSRCLRLNFGENLMLIGKPEEKEWIGRFSQLAAEGKRGLLDRYRLLDVLLGQLTQLKEEVQKTVSARSPLEKYEEIDPKLRDKWEDELSAAIEAEYRRRRSDALNLLQWLFRDVWLQTLGKAADLLTFPEFSTSTLTIAARLSEEEALTNLEALEQTQRTLYTNAQEALSLEVGLLKLKL
ncbi:MAG: DNA polymerase III subunit [Verrucomicrobiota bacterium]|nr:DNA polymerase III subunit [Verrucomicrobiota bacterium]